MTAGLLALVLLAADGLRPPPQPPQGVIAARILAMGAAVPGTRLPVLIGIRNVSRARIVVGVRRSSPALAWSTEFSFDFSETTHNENGSTQVGQSEPCSAHAQDAIALDPGQEVLRGDEVPVPATTPVGQLRVRADVTIATLNDTLRCFTGALATYATVDVDVQPAAKISPTTKRAAVRRVSVRIAALNPGSSTERFTILFGVRNRSSRRLLFPVPGAGSINHHWLNSYVVEPVGRGEVMGGIHGGFSVGSLHTPPGEACVSWSDYLALPPGGEVFLAAELAARGVPARTRVRVDADLRLLNLPPVVGCVTVKGRLATGRGIGYLTLR